MKNDFTIPSMGGGSLYSDLKRYAEMAPDDTALVELGTWVGAGTKGLLDGMEKHKRNVEIHSYDEFVIRGNEVDKAAKFNIKLKHGQNSLPLVKKWLPKYEKLFLHKGEITNTIWNKKAIFLYIDDACKYEENFIKALKIFSPYWIPNKTIIILMDFYFYLYRPNDQRLEFQKDFINLHSTCFEKMCDRKELATAIFLYKGGLKL